LKNFRIARSLRKKLKSGKYQVTFNRAFPDVIRLCAEPRSGHDGTWITRDIITTYTRLHNLKYALSVETWHDEALCGGLYGVVIGRVFFGESMFSRESDASKIAMARLVEVLQQNQFRIIDCQVYSRHLQSLGATPMERNKFVNILNRYCSENIVYQWPEHPVV
jgi:leucyl/phenylalanyl-tRNA--protein transferase